MKYFAILNGNYICESIIGTKSEIALNEFVIPLPYKDDDVLGKKYESGTWVDVPTPEPPTPEPTETEVLQAELLLNQVTILENQALHEVVLAEILLGQQGV